MKFSKSLCRSLSRDNSSHQERESHVSVIGHGEFYDRSLINRDARSFRHSNYSRNARTRLSFFSTIAPPPPPPPPPPPTSPPLVAPFRWLSHPLNSLERILFFPARPVRHDLHETHSVGVSRFLEEQSIDVRRGRGRCMPSDLETSRFHP